jgi:uncharacterized Fe-S cluster protein YjdI
MAENEQDAGHGGAGAPPDESEQNRAPDLTRVYEGDGIAVRWYAHRCVHSAACIVRLPNVFDPRRRPWVDLSQADADAIARAVEACPTGALEYDRPGAQEIPEPTTIVTTVMGGPHLLRGDIVVRDRKGDVVRRATRVALCRCGKSGNMPFCDNSHRATNRSER